MIVQTARRRNEGLRFNPQTGDTDMAKFNPFQFLQEVRSETSKVTWPTRKETLVTTAMVFVMVVLASIFFLLTDQVIRWVVSLLLGVGR